MRCDYNGAREPNQIKKDFFSEFSHTNGVEKMNEKTPIEIPKGVAVSQRT